MATSHLSSISQALAGNVEAMKIPNAAGSAYPVGTTNTFGLANIKGAADTGLPTPPNSISPNLPEAFRANFSKDVSGSPPSQVDSDIDLQDAASDHASGHDSHAQGYQTKSEDEDDAGPVGNITPAYLARNHLADLVLGKGPIAIRHVMNHLCVTVPGFADIPGPKARRITVAALESKVGGGVDGNVEFEKVGWGRWDARVRGQPSREARSIHTIREDIHDPAHDSYSAHRPTKALQIPGNGSGRSRPKQRRISHGSWTADSRYLHGDPMDRDVSESAADAMSIDLDEGSTGQAYRPRSTHQHTQQEWSSDTDEEDWSTLDPNSFKEGFSRSGPGRPSQFASRSRSRGWSPYPRSLPAQSHLHSHPHQFRPKPDLSHLDFTGTNMDSTEQDAIAALISMGSM